MRYCLSYRPLKGRTPAPKKHRFLQKLASEARRPLHTNNTYAHCCCNHFCAPPSAAKNVQSPSPSRFAKGCKLCSHFIHLLRVGRNGRAQDLVRARWGHSVSGHAVTRQTGYCLSAWQHGQPRPICTTPTNKPILSHLANQPNNKRLA